MFAVGKHDHLGHYESLWKHSTSVSQLLRSLDQILHSAGQSPRLILGAPIGGSGPAASPLGPDGHPVPSSGARSGAQAWRPLHIRAGWSPCPLLRAPTGGSSLAASPRRARQSPRPLLRAPTEGLRPGSLSARAGQSPRLLLGAPTGGSGLQRSHCLPSSPPGSGTCRLSPFNLGALVSSWVKWAW